MAALRTAGAAPTVCDRTAQGEPFVSPSLCLPGNGKLPRTHRNRPLIHNLENPTKIGRSIENTAAKIDRRISVAPMMDWTDGETSEFKFKDLALGKNDRSLYVAAKAAFFA